MAATEIAPGARLGEEGRYHLSRLLGAGGMASVWLAEDGRLGRAVAIKLLAEQLSHDPAYVQRLMREARLAAGLSHPHLVSVYDFSGGPPRPYLVMEYVPGGTLSDRLRAGTPVDGRRLAVDLLGALIHVHTAGIVHRDIKPANVLVDPSGRPRLTDFGIARPSEASALTATGLVIGTRRYIAPEILMGQRADQRSDLYSLGVLLQECVPEGGPREVRDLARCLADERPERRPSSAAEALGLLEATGGPRGRAVRAGAGAGTRRVKVAAPEGWAAARPHLRDHRPRVQRQGRQIRIGLTRTAAAALLALILLAALGVAVLAGSGGGEPTLTVPARSAPFASQIRALQSDISRARSP